MGCVLLIFNFFLYHFHPNTYIIAPFDTERPRLKHINVDLMELFFTNTSHTSHFLNLITSK